MHTVLLLLSAAATVNAWTAPTKAVHKLRVPPRRDEDRCFYGEVGVDGSVVADVAQPRADTIPPKPPSPELSPLDVVGEQFRALEREDVSHAYKFVHESIKEQYSLDVDRYEQIFKGAAYDGLLGCASWKVTALSPSPIDDDRTVASMTVLPKPVPGCVRVAGVAGQQGITWPTSSRSRARNCSPTTSCVIRNR